MTTALGWCWSTSTSFKSINHAYGHDAGDSILREFASRLRDTVRSNDLDCRIGEEFVITHAQ